MNRKPKLVLIGTLAALSANTTLAVAPTVSANGNVIFGANVTNNTACAVIVRQSGTFVPSIPGTQLSSLLPGGQSGIADVFAVFPYQIYVTPPPFFTTRPQGGDDGVSYSTYYSGTPLNARGLNFPMQPGSVPVQPGNFFSYTRLNVHLVADRPDPFPAGAYSTYATVRCE